MKTVKIEVKETLEYTREIELELPDEMTKETFQNLCTKMENDEFLGDAIYVLKRAGIVVGAYDTDLDSPDSGEVEVVEFNTDGFESPKEESE
jgi:hypothetical protein